MNIKLSALCNVVGRNLKKNIKVIQSSWSGDEGALVKGLSGRSWWGKTKVG
jgi:hypothetical protein